LDIAEKDSAVTLKKSKIFSLTAEPIINSPLFSHKLSEVKALPETASVISFSFYTFNAELKDMQVMDRFASILLQELIKNTKSSDLFLSSDCKTDCLWFRQASFNSTLLMAEKLRKAFNTAQQSDIRNNHSIVMPIAVSFYDCGDNANCILELQRLKKLALESGPDMVFSTLRRQVPSINR
jgi:hypothetical protein